MCNEFSSDNQPERTIHSLLDFVPSGRKSTYIPAFCVAFAEVAILFICIGLGLLFIGHFVMINTVPRVCHYCKGSIEFNNTTYTLQNDHSSGTELICKYTNDQGETKKHGDHYKLSCIIGLSIGVPFFLIIMLILVYVGLSSFAILWLQNSENKLSNTTNTDIDSFQYIRRNACCLGFCWPYVLCKISPNIIKHGHSNV
jgi:hypothetical protein